MNIFDDGRIINPRHDGAYEVLISHGQYLVEEDDRHEPPVWRIYGEDGYALSHVHADGRAHPFNQIKGMADDNTSPIPLLQLLLSYDGKELN